MTPERLRQLVEREARAQGFDAVGVTTPAAIAAARTGLAEYLDAGHHGDMAWMETTSERRGDPRVLWPEVRSIVVLGLNYGPDADPRTGLAARDRANISVYARNRDYHDIVKGRLKHVAQKLASAGGADVKVFVDTAPVMEKPLAAAAGLGWQGRHTNLVSREFGSWLFLGEIFTTAEIAPDAPEVDHCGSCRACLDACPTGAFPRPGHIDARRCISYLTIEMGAPIPADLRPAMGNRVYGCDDCLAACPWNKFAVPTVEAKLVARDEFRAPPLAGLADLDDAAFRTYFSGSPVKRVGRDRFLRNVLVAIGNSGDPALADVARARLRDASPLVRGAAVWALARLVDRAELRAEAAARMPAETEADVIGEWRAALAAIDGETGR
ncbi:MAG: tRNA epoxyqueuosine(34) reductase QueG [Hyphomicrobiales bacterium]